MGIGQYLNDIDGAFTQLLYQWNGYSTGIATVFAGIITYSIWTRQDPDVHPMLLARQAQGSAVRQEGESPVYRGNSAPHGMPLNSGLNVKAPGASKWSQGRDGDLRDVWQRVLQGNPEDDSGKAGLGRILTVLGSEQVIETKLEDITRQINLIGQQLVAQGGSRVAIYLPNSVEFIATLFACAFYDLTAIVLPFNISDESIISMLQRSDADAVVTATGSFPFDKVVNSYPALRQLIWVVDEGSKHLDWNEVPQGMGSKVNVSTWQDILNDAPVTAGNDLPAAKADQPPKDVVFFWPSKNGTLEEMVTFTNDNLVAAVSAQLTAIPSSQRLSPADLFLPAAPLSNNYTLVLTLAALFANASVAFNSVAGTSLDLTLAATGISPTVIVATPETLVKTHSETSSKVSALFSSLVHWLQTRTLVQSGIMPTASMITSFNDSVRPTIGVTPGKLRLVYAAEAAGSGTPKLSESVLSDLRIFTGARVIYALTAPKVAGAIAQTQFYDYRVKGDGKGTHFGSPVSSVEVILRDSGAHKTTDTAIEGEIVAKGPAVVEGEAVTGILATVGIDNTLAYI